MATYAKQWPVLTRAVLWSVIAILFLVGDALKVHKLRAAGLSPNWFLWLQIIVWSLALVVWVTSGVRAWQQKRIS